MLPQLTQVGYDVVMLPTIIANWKSHKTASEAQSWVESLAGLNWANTKVNLVIAPPFSLIPFVSWTIKSKNLPWGLAAQDISPFPAGAYTGAVSGRNLDNLGLTHVIVGHSERRRYFGETDQIVAQKVDQVLTFGWQAIVCVDDDNWRSQAELLTGFDKAKIWFAYEPKGSIGTGQAADVGRVKDMRKNLTDKFGDHSFIYGGSVDQTNIKQYLIVSDGALVGSASLEADQFSQLLLSLSDHH